MARKFPNVLTDKLHPKFQTLNFGKKLRLVVSVGVLVACVNY